MLSASTQFEVCSDLLTRFCYYVILETVKALKKLQGLPLYVSLFLVVAVVVSILSGLIFVSGQQIYRQSANDPQIQISEDIANYLSQGKDVAAVMPKSEVDISKSLVWFMMVFNDNGELVAGNAKLDGQTPVVPKGVLEHAKQNGQNRVTWEPREGVRIASVVTSYNGGSVLIGRSLRETENRVNMLHKKVLMIWILTLAATYGASWLLLSKKSS